MDDRLRETIELFVRECEELGLYVVDDSIAVQVGRDGAEEGELESLIESGMELKSILEQGYECYLAVALRIGKRAWSKETLYPETAPIDEEFEVIALATEQERLTAEYESGIKKLLGD